MKNFKRMFLFALMCAVILTMCARPAAAAGCSAKAAVVIDAKTGEILYQKNAAQQLPMASTTKIMSALIALESGIDLDEKFVVDSNAIKVEGSSMGLREGDVVTLRGLVCGMLLPSGNDAANATAVKVAGSIPEFVQMMNDRAEKMGLENTHFVTPSGLDDYTEEHYSTAYDMARLAAVALENKDFADICSQKYIKIRFGNPEGDRWLRNTNKLLERSPGIIGVKTGFTDKAKRCLVSACERDGARLICVTLNDPNDWDDHENLFNSCFSQMTDVKLPKSGEKMQIDVAGGREESVFAGTKETFMRLPKSADGNIQTKICIKKQAFAPIKKGEKLGSIKYFYNDKMICELDVKAEEDVLQPPKKENGWEALFEKLEDYLEEKDD